MTVIDLEKPKLNELTHYGVLGMKWGKRRRRQEEDTPRISKAKINLSKKEKELEKTQEKFNKHPTNKNFESVKTAEREYNYSKDDLKNAKILDKVNSKDKSKSQLSMEAKYKEKGMTDDEAAVAAYKNIRTKKILAITGGVAVASLTAYSVYKYRDNNIDKLIKSKSLLQNISADETQGVRDAFYSSGNKIDNVKYKGLYGNQIRTWEVQTPYKKEIKVLSDIKQASPKNAQKTLIELAKNDAEFAKGMKEYFQNDPGLYYSPVYAPKIELAKQSLNKGIVDKNVYEVFNASLVDHRPEMQSLTDKYYKTLANKGYNAIRDVNDNKYSGYNALNPIIAFGTKGKVEVISVKALADHEVEKSFNLVMGSKAVKELATLGSITAGGIFATESISNAAKQRSEQKYVADYRKKHPGSNLSVTEIIRNRERSQQYG